jgi:hypothetical protein
MTNLISKNDWQKYLDQLSIQKDGWESTIRVLSDEIGAQTLSEGLPFCGITYDVVTATLQLNVGGSPDGHQTHNILFPQSLAYEGDGELNPGTLEILDREGVKTLVSFAGPMIGDLQYVHTEVLPVL